MKAAHADEEARRILHLQPPAVDEDAAENPGENLKQPALPNAGRAVHRWQFVNSTFPCETCLLRLRECSNESRFQRKSLLDVRVQVAMKPTKLLETPGHDGGIPSCRECPRRGGMFGEIEASDADLVA